MSFNIKDDFDKQMSKIVNEYFDKNKNTLSFGRSIFFGSREVSISAKDIKRIKDNEKRQ